MRDSVSISPLAASAISHLALAYSMRQFGLHPGWEVDSYTDYDDIDVYLFREKGIAWIVIPGTDSWADWRNSNFFPWPSYIDGVPGRWRGGFAVAGEQAWRFATAGARKPLTARDHFVAIVGHSLGGAAALAAGALAIRDGWHDRVVLLMNVAGPRTVNRVAARYLEDYYPPEVGQRVTMGVDVVPRSVMPVGWVHSLFPFYIDPATMTAVEWRSRRRSYVVDLIRAAFTSGVQVLDHHRITSYLGWAVTDVRRRRLEAAVAAEISLGATCRAGAVSPDRQTP